MGASGMSLTIVAPVPGVLEALVEMGALTDMPIPEETIYKEIDGVRLLLS